MEYALINGKTVPADQAVVPVADRGFRYGDGLFETISVHRGVPYQLDWHMGRLSRGLKELKIAYDVAALKPQCQKLLELNKVIEGILRIQISRGPGGRGYMPDAKISPTIVIETAPMPNIAHEPIALWLSAYEKISLRALPVSSKIAQGLNSILARIEAEENDCADALMLNAKGEICETSAGNIFWLKDDILYTPALSCGVLEGSIRAAILRLSPYPVREVVEPLATVLKAEAVFLTNAIYKTLPVGLLKPSGQTWNSAALSKKMHDLIHADMLG